MSVGELQWLVGISVTVVIAVAGIAIGAYRSVVGRMDTIFNRLEAQTKDGDKELHQRINRTRDDYVRRVDLDAHMSRIDGTLAEIRRDQRSLLDRLEKIIETRSAG